MGVPSENVFYGENGHVFEFTRKAARMAGKVKAGRVFIDGLGVGDVGNIVIRDRQQLANEGVIIVVVTLDKQRNVLLSGPDLVSRGFVYVRDAGGLMNEAQQKVRQALDRCSERNLSDWSSIKVQVKETLGKFLMEKTGRRPMILPIIMEV